MKNLFIQIPCFNEEKQIGTFLDTVPRQFTNIEKVTIVVVNDGSDDQTLKVALNHSSDYVIHFIANRGLSSAFQAGIDFCLQNGADLIVNTDADNQYPASLIQQLIDPIVNHRADFTIGDRQTQNIEDFSLSKKILQKLGTLLASRLSGLQIHDAASGFRAYSREAASHLNVTNSYTYTLETLIQLGSAKMALVNVPIQVNPATRESRLFKSNSEYVRRNGLILLRTYAQYAPLKIFGGLSGIMCAVATLSFMPSIFSLLLSDGRGHLQSLIFGAVCLLFSIQLLGIGLLADSTRSLRFTVKKGNRVESPLSFKNDKSGN